MAVDKEELFALVAPYIQNFEEIRQVLEGLEGLSTDDARARVQGLLEGKTGTIRTDLQILLGKLG